MTGSDPAGYDSGDLYHNNLVTWIDISKLFILFHVMYIKAFTESKVRNVVDIWEDEYKIQDHLLVDTYLVSAPYLMKHTFVITSPIIVMITIVRHHKINVLCNSTIN